MTDAAAYPTCVHGRKVYERCEPCEEGAKRGEHGGFLRAPESSEDPNPLSKENHYFRKCLNGHVDYSASFDECPSCKIERNRSSKPITLKDVYYAMQEDFGRRSEATIWGVSQEFYDLLEKQFLESSQREPSGSHPDDLVIRRSGSSENTKTAAQSPVETNGVDAAPPYIDGSSGIDEFVADLERDPVWKADLDEARAEIAAEKTTKPHDFDMAWITEEEAGMGVAVTLDGHFGRHLEGHRFLLRPINEAGIHAIRRYKAENGSG